jgi:uncharacterized protein YndB with AHSA1/START domain
MIEFVIETDIARPVAVVFAYVTDPAKLATWQTNTVSVTVEGDGSFGVGTRLREIHRVPGGKQLPSIAEVSEYELDRVFALQVLEGPLPMNARITFEAATIGTRVGFTVQGESGGALRVAQPLLARALKRQFAGHCDTLKTVLEQDQPGV